MDLPSLRKRVFLITGGTSGIGHELAKILMPVAECTSPGARKKRLSRQ
jgi:NAD(P)-dependent dehydrogenase (short-subunit alcohol dehydrogenase family)